MKITAYKTAKGKTRYMFNAYLGIDPLTNKEIRTTRRGFKSKTEAKKVYAELISGLEEMNDKDIKLSNLIKDWLKSYKNRVKPSTYKTTYDLIANHILHTFGNAYVKDIQIKHIQEWLNDKAKEVVKAKEINTYLKIILDYAIAQGYIDSNPAKYVTFPKNIAKKKKTIDVIWTPEQLNIFLDYVKYNYHIKWYAFFRLLAYTGMRRGEILALEWKDLDTDTKLLTISKSLKISLNGTIVGNTKTNRTRIISIDDETVRTLIEWRKMQVLSPIMFTNSLNTYMLLNHPLKKLNSILNNLELPRIDIHRFRHIHTSLLVLAGVPIEQTMDRLGHSDIKTTINIYNHINENEKENSIEKFTKLMG